MWAYGEFTSDLPSVDGLPDEQSAVDMAGQLVGERTIRSQTAQAVKLYEGDTENGWEPRGYIVGTPMEGEPNKAVVTHRDRL